MFFFVLIAPFLVCGLWQFIRETQVHFLPEFGHSFAKNQTSFWLAPQLDPIWSQCWMPVRSINPVDWKAIAADHSNLRQAVKKAVWWSEEKRTSSGKRIESADDTGLHCRHNSWHLPYAAKTVAKCVLPGLGCTATVDTAQLLHRPTHDALTI